MMRIIVAMFLGALALACAHNDAGKSGMVLSGADPAGESTSFFDSTLYIGYVDYFPDTHEFYTALFYREGYEYPDDELLEAQLDSVIEQNDDWGRERLPIEKARNILVLAGMDSISIFNRRHELVGTCALSRVEYLWNGLESYFIAVYKSDQTYVGQTEELYGITARYAEAIHPSFSAEEIVDHHLDEYLWKKLNLSRGASWDMRHYKVAPTGTMYSIISSYSMESNEGYSYLTSLDRNKVEVLNQEVNDYHFLNILPVPILVNGRPLLLISAGYPSSDVLWDYLAGFNGTAYEAMDYNRINVNSIGANMTPPIRSLTLAGVK